MKSNQIKRANLTSTVGAGVLGAGIGLLFNQYLAAYAIAILVLGLFTHSWGMYHSHRLQAAEPNPRWTEWLYWACWISLAPLLVFVVAGSF